MDQKPKIEVHYKPGKELLGISATVLHSFLMQIKENQPDGRLTPEVLVKVSESKNSLLHPFFDWSNSRAAHKFRMLQARGLINRTYIAVCKPGAEKRKSGESPVVIYKAIISARDPEKETKNSYHSVVEVARRPDMSNIYLNRLKNKVRAIIKEFESSKELAEILNTLKTEL